MYGLLDVCKENPMFRLTVVGIIGFGLTASAAAQTVQWISNINQGVGQAKRTGLPLLLYITGSDKDGGDIKDNQQRAFRDPLVREIVSARFVPVRQAYGSASKQVLQEVGASPETRLAIVCITPNGKLVGTVGTGQIEQARALATQLTMLFRTYRTGVFERELKPKLEDDATRPGDIIKALKVIEKLLIIEADQGVVKLLENEKLASTVRKQVYGVLAVLSTPRCVKALLEAAPNDKLAATALKRCTPAGAEEMLSALDLEKPGELPVAYDAVTKICKIKGAKPRGFWNGKNERLLYDEIERVEAEVRKSAKRWRDRYEAYR
jgi:hypothetical protein